MSNRSYTQKTIKILYGESGNLCAFPKCKNNLIEDGVVVSNIAHILPASPDGPRGDGKDTEDADSTENLIILCLKHHKIVDDKPTEYDAELLRKYKSDHIAKIKKMGIHYSISDDDLKAAHTQLNLSGNGDVTGSQLVALQGDKNLTSLTVFNIGQITGSDPGLVLQTAAQYNQEVQTRHSELNKELQAISIDKDMLMQALSDPNVYDFVSKAFNTAALADNPDMYKILAKAIAERIKKTDDTNSRKDVAFAQVPELISRLTINQMKLIAINYVATNLAVTQSPSLQFVNGVFANIIYPLGDITFHNNDVNQIGGTNAATFLSFMENKAFDRVKTQYEHLFIKPIPSESLEGSDISPEVIPAFFRKTDDGYVLAGSLEQIEKFLEANKNLHGLEPIKQLCQMQKMSDEEIKQHIKSNAPALDRLIQINDETNMSNISLTLPGKALGMAVLEGFSGQSLDSVWVSDNDQVQFPLK